MARRNGGRTPEGSAQEDKLVHWQLLKAFGGGQDTGKKDGKPGDHTASYAGISQRIDTLIASPLVKAQYLETNYTIHRDVGDHFPVHFAIQMN